MTVRATWNGTVIAESEATISCEGNDYFPPKDVNAGYLEPSATTTHCPWKGDASYFDLVVDGERNPDAVWVYRAPFDAAEDIRDHLAFWHGVEVSGSNPGSREIRPPQH